uniref:Uncharacterized protein n=1 Tax=Anguilla anguilla TaxID=7936 RepID=A0A0E9XFV3_ANGAN
MRFISLKPRLRIHTRTPFKIKVYVKLLIKYKTKTMYISAS